MHLQIEFCTPKMLEVMPIWKCPVDYFQGWTRFGVRWCFHRERSISGATGKQDERISKSYKTMNKEETYLKQQKTTKKNETSGIKSQEFEGCSRSDFTL